MSVSGLPYDEQMRHWASWKYDIPLREIAKVDLKEEYDEGYPCCGGTDPGCYCSLATGASLDFYVTVWGMEGQPLRKDSLDYSFGDLHLLLKEIIGAKGKS